MEDLASSNIKFQKELAVLADLFQDFEFEARPVFGHVLLSYATILHVLLRTYAPDAKSATAMDLAREYFEGTPLPVGLFARWMRPLPAGMLRGDGSGRKAPQNVKELVTTTVMDRTVNPHAERQVTLKVDMKKLEKYVYSRLKQADSPWDYVKK